MDASETRTDGRGVEPEWAPADANADRDASGWHRRRWTTIVLESDEAGWRATQTGVDVEGRGATAADAAADYCRRIAETGETGPASEGEGRNG